MEEIAQSHNRENFVLDTFLEYRDTALLGVYGDEYLVYCNKPFVIFSILREASICSEI